MESNQDEIYIQNTGKSTELVPMDELLPPRAILMRSVNKKLPLNDFGLPEYIYRPDFLPNSLSDLNGMDPKDQSEALEVAIVELSYDEGYPTVYGGEPFWSRMPHEPTDAFKAFTMYLDLPRHNASRGSTSYADKPNQPRVAAAATAVEMSPVRQLTTLKAMLNRPSEDLIAMAHMFYWKQRAQAYDAFIIASHSKLKEHRLMNVELEHYEMSTNLMATAKTQIDSMLADPEKYGLKPNHVIELLKFSMGAQRLALGAQPFSATPAITKQENLPPQNQSLEVIMRTLMQSANADSGNIAGGKTINNDEGIQNLFKDPNMLGQAQELIVKMMNTSNPRKIRNATLEEAKEDPFG